MAEDRLTCSQKQPHPVLRTLRAPGKYLGLGWQKDLLGLCKPRCRNWIFQNDYVAGRDCFVPAYSSVLLWNVSSDWSDLHREVSQSQGPTIKDILKGNQKGPLCAGTQSSGGKLNYDLRIIPLAPLGRCHHVCQSLLGKKNKNIPLPVIHRGEQAKGRERRTN